MAGLATLLVGQPFDTVKVRMQTVDGAPQSFVTSAYRCLSNEGIRGLYKGTTPQLVGSAVQHSTRYAAYAEAKQVLTSEVAGFSSPTAVGCLGGVATGCCVAIVATPVELVPAVD